MELQNPFGAQILKDFLITIGQEKKWLNTLFCRNYEGCIEERTKALRKGNDKNVLICFLSIKRMNGASSLKIK